MAGTIKGEVHNLVSNVVKTCKTEDQGMVGINTKGRVRFYPRKCIERERSWSRWCRRLLGSAGAVKATVAIVSGMVRLQVE